MKLISSNILKGLLFTIIVLLLGFFFGRALKSEADAPDSVDEHHHSNETNKNTSANNYTCSMHPQIRANKTDKCPLCGMDLIPISVHNEGNTEDSSQLSMSKDAMKLAEIITEKVSMKSAVKEVKMSGKIVIDERKIYTQTSHISGRLEKLNVNFIGRYVRENEIIAHIYSPLLITAQQELFEANKVKNEYPDLLKSSKNKLRNWKISQKQIDDILAKGVPDEYFPILANNSGYVTKRMVNLGEHVAMGESLFEIADLSSLWVIFDLYESDIQWVKKGMKVDFSVPSLPEQVFSSKISYVNPIIDAKYRVLKIRLDIKNPNLLLKPEMLVEGILKSNIKAEKLFVIVPKSAVLWTGNHSLVYIKTTDDNGIHFQRRKVMLGPSLGNSYIINAGLKVGEEIAVNGTFSIDAATQLENKPSMMNEK